MTQKQARWHTQLRLLVIGGAIAISPHSTIAQHIPIADETLVTRNYSMKL
jgi:hypothetical protein